MVSLKKKIIFSIIITFTFICIAETFVRLVMFVKNNDHCAYRIGIEKFSSLPHNKLGYIPSPGKKIGCRKEVYTLNQNSLRKTNENNSSLNKDFLITGDSFGYGDEVSDQNVFSFLINKKTKKNLMNGSVYGYGLDQALIRAEEILEKNQNLKFIYAVIAGGAIDRVLLKKRNGIRKPYYTIENNKLVYHPIKNIQKFDQSTKDHFIFKSYLIFNILKKLGFYSKINRPEYSIEKDEVKLSCEITNYFNKRFLKRGVVLKVVYFRSGYEIFYEREVNINQGNNYIQCLKSKNIEVIDTLNTLKKNKDKKLYFSKNLGHPTEFSHQLISDLMIEEFSELR